LVTEELRFDEQVAVITGAGGGLGKQYALLLATRGACVVVNDIGGSVTGVGSNTEAANVVAEEIRQRGGEAVADTNSVTGPEGGTAIIDTALRAWGRVDIVINNAGIVGDAPFQDMTPDRLEPLVDVHLKGAFYVTRPSLESDVRAGVWPGTQHLLGRGNPGCRRHEQLRRGQDRVDRFHPSAGRRGSRPQHQGQRHRSDRLHPDAGALRRRRRPAGRRVGASGTG
jgi:NAD(P)-dependent dehydrogenase (short-subunit alcohol dehydrogenase family)